MFNIYIYFGLNKLNKHEVTQLVGDGGWCFPGSSTVKNLPNTCPLNERFMRLYLCDLFKSVNCTFSNEREE